MTLPRMLLLKPSPLPDSADQLRCADEQGDRQMVIRSPSTRSRQDPTADGRDHCQDGDPHDVKVAADRHQRARDSEVEYPDEVERGEHAGTGTRRAGGLARASRQPVVARAAVAMRSATADCREGFDHGCRSWVGRPMSTPELDRSGPMMKRTPSGCPLASPVVRLAGLPHRSAREVVVRVTARRSAGQSPITNFAMQSPSMVKR